MKKNYKTSSCLKGWKNAAAMLALFTTASLSTASAQEGSQGNTTIFGGAQMTYFGNQNFLTGGAGTQPGVILTERATATISYLNFSGDNLTATGVTDASYVDGYVRKYGTGQFIFPVGDNGFAGQFAASADGTSGAYFHADPTTAVTSNLFTGSNYPVLPAGGPFASTARGTGVRLVSTVEYWDIDGANATPITLTWDAGSLVSTLTNNTLSYLTIVGWNGTQWVRIPSTVDVTSVLGGASALAAGSITTTASIVPNTYTAYTLAGTGPDLSPRITVTPSTVHGVTSLEVIVAAVEVSNIVPSNGSEITVRVRKNPILTGFVWNPTTTSSGNGTSIQNSIWAQTEDANYYIFKTSTVIPRNSQRRLLFNITLNPGATDGVFSLATSIPTGGSGGEFNYLNNQDADVITFFAN